MDKNIIFRLNKVSKKFFLNKFNGQFKNKPGKIDISGISLEFKKSESIGLTGARSSGASTIASILSGEILPDAGSFYWEDVRISQLPRNEYFDYLKKIRVVSPVKLSVFKKRKTVSEYIRDVLRQMHQLSDEYEDNMVNELLKSVGLGSDVVRKHLSQLSENQLKQVLVAKALAGNPKYIIADELTTQSNSQIKHTLYELLLKLRQRLGIGLLLIDNDIANLCNYTDRIGIMMYGRLVEVGMTDDIINSPMHPYTKRVIELSNQRTSLTRFQLDEDISDHSAPVGCPYARKCKFAEVKCRLIDPDLRHLSNMRSVACHHVEEERTSLGSAATG